MSATDIRALGDSRTKSRQFDLAFLEDSDTYSDPTDYDIICESVEKPARIENSDSLSRPESCAGVVDAYDGDLDVLCLETACAGVLLSLRCELVTYAELYAVPETALRAFVGCAFIDELDHAIPFLEEERKPLTRAKLLKVLKRTQRMESERVKNAKYPYRVPKEKWNELLHVARGQ
ncbi:MAG TPA: hypothetical protein VMI32_12970 [Candidatus Solibacter sp.]|nr:hypothetical protein [Candidatus Solibacter sp.]